MPRCKHAEVTAVKAGIWAQLLLLALNDGFITSEFARYYVVTAHLSSDSRLSSVAAFCDASAPLSRSRFVTFFAMSLNVHGSASGEFC